MAPSGPRQEAKEAKLLQTWGQVHEYLYLSTDLKVLVLYLNTSLISPVYLYLYSSTLLSTCMYLST